MNGAAAALLLVAASLAALRPAEARMLEVTSAADAGPGTLRHAIRAANAEPGSVITIALGERAEIRLSTALPALVARGTRLDGRGATLREAPGCRRSGGKAGCDGIVVSGEGIEVRSLRVAGFTFDGVAVRGAAAREVRLVAIEAVDNLDDGIGVSNGAGPVLVDRSLMMGNGYRTKGKGLLAFDAATVTLRDSVVTANRDGITVTQDSVVTLERVDVIGNWDKGVGISGGRLRGGAVRILANGRDREARAPNADGLRVGLGGSCELTACRIAGNGDGGVVVLDDSAVTLSDCIVEANHGRPVTVSGAGRFREGRRGATSTRRR